jgi:hypothetical protein
MIPRENLEKLYKELSNLLPVVHPQLSFENHCYLRIVNDMTCGAKWDTVVERPFIKNATDKQLLTSVKFLSDLLCIKDSVTVNRILFMNSISLEYRKKIKHVGSIIKVSYMPSLTEVMKAFIKQNVQAAFENEDVGQYNLEFVMDSIKEQEDFNQFILEDIELLKYMIENGIEYIEI